MEDPTLTAKAEAFKNKGNDEFKRGNYNESIEKYTEAIGKYNQLFDLFNLVIIF
jgi:tetratricopeptide (TPR) repeat protein